MTTYSSCGAEAPAGARFCAPLVEHELALLRAAWERVCAKRCPHSFTLLGDASVGKSRLVHEFVPELELEAKVLVGRCLPHGEGLTLAPRAEIRRGAALVPATAPAEVAVGKIVELVETAIPAELVGDRRRTQTRARPNRVPEKASASARIGEDLAHAVRVE